MEGGYQPHDIDDSARQAAESVRAAVSHQLGGSPVLYEVIEAHSQVVAGTRFKLKVRISDSECVHLRVYVPLPHLRMLPRLDDFQAGLRLDSPLV